MPLEPGTTLGPYSVTAKIGVLRRCSGQEGGMGEVYQADGTWQYGWLIRSASVGHGMEHDVDPEGVAVR